MDQSHQEHLERITQSSVRDLAIKYPIGQAANGGRLWLKSGIVKNIREEKTDLDTYSHVLEEQLRHVENLLLAGESEQALKWVQAMLSEKMEEVID